MRAVVTNTYQQKTEICHDYIEAHSDFLYPLQVKCLFYNPTVVSEWCIVFLSKDGFLKQKHNHLQTRGFCLHRELLGAPLQPRGTMLTPISWIPYNFCSINSLHGAGSWHCSAPITSVLYHHYTKDLLLLWGEQLFYSGWVQQPAVISKTLRQPCPWTGN